MLKTQDGRDFPASIKRKTWFELLKREDFNPNQKSYWRVYFRTTKLGILTKVELIKPLNHLVFPILINPQGETLEDYRDLFKVRGKIQEINKTAFVVRIERNEPPQKGRPNNPEFLFFNLTIQGNLPPQVVPEQFWEIFCTRDGDYLRLKKATLITDDMVKAFEGKSLKSGKRTKSAPAKTKASKLRKTDNLTQEQPVEESVVIMIKGTQPELTVKFNQRPQLPAEGKKVTLQVTEEKGIVVKAELNRKTLAKQVEKMDSFESWGAALSGKIAEISSEGVIILEAAGLKVFEKKQKHKVAENQESAA